MFNNICDKYQDEKTKQWISQDENTAYLKYTLTNDSENHIFSYEISGSLQIKTNKLDNNKLNITVNNKLKDTNNEIIDIQISTKNLDGNSKQREEILNEDNSNYKRFTIETISYGENNIIVYIIINKTQKSNVLFTEIENKYLEELRNSYTKHSENNQDNHKTNQSHQTQHNHQSSTTSSQEPFIGAQTIEDFYNEKGNRNEKSSSLSN